MARVPLITLYKLFPAAPAPRRADAGLGGSMPARAFHYCEPFRAASSFGWYIYPPIDFDLLWDGTTVHWRGAGARDWSVLDTADLPGFAGLWNLAAPVADVLPRPVYFMHAPRGEPGIVLISTGILAKTRPGWSLLVRRPANLPQELGFEVLEGVVETDWWFGPIASNIRLRKTDYPVCFRREYPLYQIQPIPQEAYAEENLNDVAVHEGFAAVTEEDWQAYRRTILPRNTPGTRPGWYKAEVHRRQRLGCPVQTTQAQDPVPACPRQGERVDGTGSIAEQEPLAETTATEDVVSLREKLRGFSHGLTPDEQIALGTRIESIYKEQTPRVQDGGTGSVVVIPIAPARHEGMPVARSDHHAGRGRTLTSTYPPMLPWKPISR